MSRGDLLDENKGVPLRWLIVTIGTAISCLGASLYLAFSIGSISAKFVNADDFEGFKKTGREHYEELIQRMTAVEAGQKILEKQNDMIIEQLRRDRR